jgi:thiol-disulfide isomerase/thioredoxin
MRDLNAQAMYIYSRQLSGSQQWQAIPVRGLGESQPAAKQIYAGQTGIKTLTDSDFWNIFKDRNKVQVVSFWSDTCRPCDKVATILASVAGNYRRTFFGRLVNFNQIQWDPKVNPQIFQRFGLKGTPVVYFYYTATGQPPGRTAPLLEGSLGPDDWQSDAEQYDWRIKAILRRHGHGHTVRIILIDLTNFFKSKDGLRKQFSSRLEDKFNNLDPKWLQQQLLTFKVLYRSTEPTTLEKENFGNLDFPVYLVGQQHNFDFVRRLMQQHRIPTTIQCPNVRQSIDPFERIKACWEDDGRRGCAVPPGQGFRKVGFVKTHKVSADPVGRRNPAQAFLSVTAHELGHMHNLCFHLKDGLMKSPVPLDREMDFSPGAKGMMLTDLVRLRDL